MKSLLPVVAFLMVPTLAIGQTYCEGRVNDGNNQLALSWNDCWYPGSTAGTFKTLNCNPTPTTNATAVLHLQFKSPLPFEGALAATATLNLFFTPVPLPPFYHYENTGCAGSGVAKGLSVSAHPASVGCLANDFDSFCDDGTGQNACSMSEFIYLPDMPYPGRARLTLSLVRNDSRPIEAYVNLWLCQLTLSNSQRTACAGCSSPLTIVWDKLGIETEYDPRFICLAGLDEAKGPDRAGFNGGPLDPVPVLTPTWGQIKALY